jgi:hypothetical protein
MIVLSASHTMLEPYSDGSIRRRHRPRHSRQRAAGGKRMGAATITGFEAGKSGSVRPIRWRELDYYQMLP